MHTNHRSIESQLRRFCHEQELNSLKLPRDAEFLHLVHNSMSTTTQQNLCSCIDDEQVTRWLKLAQSPLQDIDTFAINPAIVQPLPPFEEKILPLAHAKELQSIYEQLYPRKKTTHMLLFYRQCGRIKLAGNIIGSIKRGSNSTTSAIVICMSFWPESGHSLQSIEYGRMRVGVVQYFLQHSVTVCDNEPSSSETLCHLLCYIHWKKVHPHADWCGISATICTELFETPDVCCFMPAQRIGF